MKFAISRAAMKWLVVNALVLSMMFNLTYSAAKTVENSMPEMLEPVASVENVYIYADHVHNSPQSLKNGRNPGFIEDYELSVEPSKVVRDTYFNVPLDYELQDHIFRLCEDYGVDPSIIIAMIWKESTFRVETVGDGGDSLGLMQIQPKWHQERMDRLGVLYLANPYQNVMVGIDYFAELMANGRGLEWSLMAYNGGYGYANRKVANGEVSYYARKVIEKAASLEMVEVERVVNE